MNLQFDELGNDDIFGNIAISYLEDEEARFQDLNGDGYFINYSISKNIMIERWWLSQFSNLADTSLPNKEADSELDIDIIIPIRYSSKNEHERRFSLQLPNLSSLITGVSNDSLFFQLKRKRCNSDSFSCVFSGMPDL